MLAAACGGGQGDVTVRTVTDQQLSLMGLSLTELGPKYAEFELHDSSGFVSNAEAIEGTFDREGEAEDVERFGRLNGYDTDYSSQEAIASGEGAFAVFTSAILHEDADGASGNLRDFLVDAKRRIGGSAGGLTLEGVEEFDVRDVGEEAVGVLLEISASTESGRAVTFATAVIFRRASLVGTVEIDSFDETDAAEEVAALARKMDDRIEAVLRGEVEP